MQDRRAFEIRIDNPDAECDCVSRGNPEGRARFGWHDRQCPRYAVDRAQPDRREHPLPPTPKFDRSMAWAMSIFVGFFFMLFLVSAWPRLSAWDRVADLIIGAAAVRLPWLIFIKPKARDYGD